LVRPMMVVGKRLVLGFVLILVASTILLATDRERRHGDGPRVWDVALFQHASTPVLDDGADGIIAGLAEHGFRQGDNLRITRYNAQGDVGTASTIAREILNGPFDLVITVSTPSLQAVASANKDRQKPHVFSLVADPPSAGVGIDREHPELHPP